jgi:Cu2+-exporting ATPase
VAFLGDGINDIPAISTADVGISIGSALGHSLEFAQIVFTRAKLIDLLVLMKTCKLASRKALSNVIISVMYNAIAIPAAAGLLWPRFTLTPAACSVLMFLSSLTVIASSLQLLARKKSLENFKF